MSRTTQVQPQPVVQKRVLSSRPRFLAGCRFRILATLGEGGFGAVFGCYDRLRQKRVALKTCASRGAPGRPEANVKAGERFRREFHLARTLSHPGVVRAFDFGVLDSGELYYTMDWCAGKPLSSFAPLEKLDFLPDLIRKICGVLEFLHAFHIVHSDLKSSNILVRFDPQAPQGPWCDLKLMDFGLAEEFTFGAPQTQAGTLEYMAPEMIEGKGGDARADLYSLGCVLYELVTGRTPFASVDPLSVVEGHLAKAPASPAELRSELSPLLNDLILKLLAKNPAERMQSAREVAAQVVPIPVAIRAPEPFAALRNYMESGLALALGKNTPALVTASAKRGVVGIAYGGRTTILGPPPSDTLEMQLQAQGFATVTLDAAVPQPEIARALVKKLWLVPGAHDGQRSAPQPTHLRHWLRVSEAGRGDAGFSERALEELTNWITAQMSAAGKISPPAVIVQNVSQGFLETAVYRKVLTALAHSGHCLVILCPGKSERYADDRRLWRGLNSGATAETWEFPRMGGGDFNRSTLVPETVIAPSDLSRLWEIFGREENIFAAGLRFLHEKNFLESCDGLWRVNRQKMEGFRLPRPLRRSLIRQVSHLNPEQCALLRAGSIFSGPFTALGVARLTGLTRPVAEKQVATLQKERVLNLVTGSETSVQHYGFGSALLRRALYESISASQRRAGHRKVLKFLISIPDSTPEGQKSLADHALASDDATEAVTRVLAYAGLCVEKNEREETLLYFARAERKARRVRESNLRKQLLARVLFERADRYKGWGDFEPAEKDFRIVLSLIPVERDPSLHAEVYRKLADLYRWQNRLDDAGRTIEQAIALLQKTGDRVALSRAYNNLGIITWRKGDVPQSVAYYETAYQIQKEQGLAQEAILTLNNLGIAYIQTHRFSTALKHYAEALELGRREGTPETIAHLLNNIGFTHASVGSLAEGKPYFTESLSLRRALGKKSEILLTLINLSWLAYLTGDPDGLKQLGQEAIALAQEVDDPQSVAEASFVLAEESLREGDYAGAYALVQAPQMDAVDTFISNPVARAAFWVRFYAGQGDCEGAESAAARAKEVAERSGDLRNKVLSQIAGLTLALAAENGWEESAALLREAERTIEPFEGLLEKSQLQLCKVRHALRSGAPALLPDELAKLDTLLAQCESAPLLAERFFLEGKWRSRRRDFLKATQAFTQANNFAGQAGYRELLWRIGTEAGRVAATIGDYETAFREYRSAYEIVKVIYSCLSDPAYQVRFIADPMVVTLVTEMKKLAGRLVAK